MIVAKLSFLGNLATLCPSMTELKKRKLLSSLGIVILVVAAYGSFKAYEAKRITDASWPTLEGGVYESAVTRDEVTSLIPGDEIYDSGVLEGGIPALTNPKYDSVLASDAVIADSLYGIDLEIAGEHRFYPVQIMNWHEVVNDTIDGRDVAITYCPLCGTGVVYDRSVNLSFDNFEGTETLSFSATGRVYNNNTILKDSTTNSLWIQATGTAVQGSAIGRSLTVIPSRMMTWATWKDLYPSGLVLSTNTGYERDYTRHPYGNYDTSKGLYFPLNYTNTAAFSPKWVTYAVTDGVNGVVFADMVLGGTGLNTAKLSDVDVIAVYDFDRDSPRVFYAQDESGDALTFSFDFAKKRLTDNETGSVWSDEGRAISGSMKGTQLRELTVTRGYWFCISAMHPTWTPVTTAVPVEATDDTTDNTVNVPSGT